MGYGTFELEAIEVFIEGPIVCSLSLACRFADIHLLFHEPQSQNDPYRLLLLGDEAVGKSFFKWAVAKDTPPKPQQTIGRESLVELLCLVCPCSRVGHS